MSLSTPRQIIRSVDRMISKHGWARLDVGGSSERPQYSYTIGLEETFKHPELLMIGFRRELMRGILQDVVSRLPSRDVYLPPKGGLASRVVRDFNVLIRPVPCANSMELAQVAHFRAEGRPVKLLQICLPDARGRQVDDPLCDSAFRDIQDFTRFE